MSAMSFAADEKSNLASERSACRNTSAVRPIAVIAAAARRLWRNKVAAELAERSGVSVRSAENYLAGDRDMNGNALVRLLQSDAGPDFLAAMIADLPPSRREAWRKEFDNAARRAVLRDELAELERTIPQRRK
jgi:hypothetical protein